MQESHRIGRRAAALMAVFLLLLQGSAVTVAGQGTGSLRFTGVVLDSEGQQIPAGTPVAVFATASNSICGQGAVNADGYYTVLITSTPACTAVGTMLVFQVGSVPAAPAAMVTIPMGTVDLNLSLSSSAPSGSGLGAILTPPASPPTTAGVPVSNSGTLVPPSNPLQTANPSTVSGAGLATTTAGTRSASAQPQTHTVTEPLTTGCNQVVVAFGAGAAPQQIVSATSNASAVLSVWRFDNTAQRYQGYFPGPGVPSDLTSLQPVDAVFVCVNANTSLNAPQP